MRRIRRGGWPLRRLAPLLMLVLALSGCARHAQPGAEPTRPAERVLVVGNSLAYHNDLPAHLAAVATAVRGAPVEAEMVAAGGRRIARHAADGVVLKEIASGRYRALVLQEWGGGLLCGEQQARLGFDCAASQAAHRQLADAAQARGMRVVILGTPQAIPVIADALAEREAALARALGAAHVDLRSLPARIRTQPQAQWLEPDGHPGPDLTLWMAHDIARALYGDAPLSTPFEIAYRDYRQGATPKADALASAQDIAAQQRVRTIQAEDLARLTAQPPQGP